MYFTSENFNRRIRESGKRKTVVDIVTSAGSVLAENIVVESGSVKVDRNAAVRRHGSVVIPDRDLVPSFATGTLVPYGTEIRIRQGMVYGDGSEELVPIGTFILDTTSWSEDTGPIPTIEFFDRAMVMERADIGPQLDYAGWLPEDVIENLIAYFWPELIVTFDDGLTSDRNPGGTSFNSGNHWDVVQTMARKMGAEIYFDVVGNPVVRKLPVLTEQTEVSEAVWEVTTGEQGILIGADRSITRNEVYNSVYVVGATTTTAGDGIPPVGHAFNINPESPTNRNGPFRKMGIRISDNTISTFMQAKTLAEQKLAEYTRLSQKVSFEAVPNPAVDVGDIVAFSYLSGEKQVGMIESLTIPIGKGPMTGECSVAKV